MRLTTRPRSLAALIAVLSAAMTGAMVVVPAGAAPPTVTRCSVGENLVNLDIEDLVVPDDGNCVLTTSHVHGTITVGHDAELRLDGSTADHGITAGHRADVGVDYGSSVAGPVRLEEVTGFGVFQSTLTGPLTGTLQAPAIEKEDTTYLSIKQSVINGSVDATLAGDFRFAIIDGSTVTGDLRIHSATTYVRNSQVHGQVVLNDLRTDNEQDELIGSPSNLCGTTVDGNVTLQQSPGYIQLGGGDQCAGGQPITVGGSLLILDNTGPPVHLAAHVHGNLVCRGNTHHPIASHPASRHLAVTVGGHLLGQCTNLPTRPKSVPVRAERTR